jgi:hypothetical protein
MREVLHMKIAELFLKLRADIDRNVTLTPFRSKASSYFNVFGVCSLLAVGMFAYSGSTASPAGGDLTAHEWGTFTSIAGNDGQAIVWRPQSRSTDLPAFVEHLEGADFKGGLGGTVRMETPVLYFYTSLPKTVSVHVAFKNGLITEWYPAVSKATPTGDLRNIALNDERTQGEVWWKSVHLEPSSPTEYPKDEIETHYYAARETSSTPLRVILRSGIQREKFLFYRGVADFRVPVAVTSNRNGDVAVRNLGPDEISGLILFERRGERIGYRIGGPLQSEIPLEAPELTASVDSLRADLENELVARGLFADEAHAMVETWRDSWFQEGSRVLYFVPGSFVNAHLPLEIHPAPVQVVRVFVGRVEVVTQATRREVETALARHDSTIVERFGRFLMPILEVLGGRDPQHARRLYDSLAALER